MHEREISSVLVEMNRLLAKITDYQSVEGTQSVDDGYEMLRATLDTSRALEKLRRKMRAREAADRAIEEEGDLDYGQALGEDTGETHTDNNPAQSDEVS